MLNGCCCDAVSDNLFLLEEVVASTAAEEQVIKSVSKSVRIDYCEEYEKSNEYRS